jgi:hypothetical protein
MKTRITVQIQASDKPVLRELSPGEWEVEFTTKPKYVKYGRAVWVTSEDPDTGKVKDGKGFLFGPTRKLTVG